MEGHRSDREAGSEFESQDCDHWESEERITARTGTEINEAARSSVYRRRPSLVSGERKCCLVPAGEQASLLSLLFCCWAPMWFIRKPCGKHSWRKTCRWARRNLKTSTGTSRAEPY